MDDINISDIFKFYGSKPKDSTSNESSDDISVNFSENHIDADENSPESVSSNGDRVKVIKFADTFARTTKKTEKKNKKYDLCENIEPNYLDFVGRKMKNLTNIELEKLASEQLTGKDRHQYMLSKMDDMGIKAKKEASRSAPKPRLPVKIAQGMLRISKCRAKKFKNELQEAGDDIIASSSSQSRRVGISLSSRNSFHHDLIVSSSSNPLIEQISRKKQRDMITRVTNGNRRKDRGLKSSIGKFKNGELKIRPWELKKLNEKTDIYSRKRT